MDRSRWAWLPQFAGEQLPRYTSYPPANRFQSGFGGAQADRALSGLAAGSQLSLYVHIPYCKQLCWYCGCHTSVPTRADPVDPYLHALRMEIERTARLVPDTCVVTHVHFGGGSPDILPPAEVGRLMRTLQRNFTFARDCEIAAELDPRGVTLDLAEAFADSGLTRASFGVQTLDPGIQRAINRIQPPECVSEAIARVRVSGVRAINLDIMYGLPLQTEQNVVDTALFAAMEDADRIAVFGYAHVPWFKKHQGGIDANDLPSGEARFRQAEAAARTLRSAGYEAVGLDHFAAPGDALAEADRMGTLRRNFQGYTDDQADALIGFGASAISSLPDCHFQNTPDTAAYRLAAAGKTSPVVRGVALTAEDRLVANTIQSIMCQLETPIPGELRAMVSSTLPLFAQAGLVRLTDSHLSVTARGRPYLRNIAAAFDPGLAATAARHSVAI